jgi:valyl-tRNA synthetase
MPFITEELWHGLGDRSDSFINNESWPDRMIQQTPIHPNAFELISEIRAKRNENGISPKVPAALTINAKDVNTYTNAKGIIAKLANVETFSGDIPDGFKVLVGTDEITIGFKDFVKKVDTTAIESEIKRLQGFLVGIAKKLGNEKFIANAKPDVIAKEEQKKSDTLSKIASLESQLT